MINVQKVISVSNGGIWMITDYFYYLSDYADIGDVEYDQGPIPQNTFHFPFPGKWGRGLFYENYSLLHK